MDLLAKAIINMPAVFVSLLLNLFFIYCLRGPSASGKIKQPLKILLETMISCSVVYLLSMVFKCISDLVSAKTVNGLALLLLSRCVVSTSMTSSVWLNFCYYSQIVPARRALSIWIQNNIKLIIYSAWVFERIWTLSDVTFLLLELLSKRSTNISTEMSQQPTVLTVYFIFNCLFKAYLVLSMCVMVVSSASISLYLFKHMQRMQGTDQSSFSSTFYSQLRVAVTGILQGLLYLLCGLWITSRFIYEITNFTMTDSGAHYTVINMYICGTTLNMWMGQTVFRQRSIALLQALKHRSLISEDRTGATRRASAGHRS